MCPKYDNNVYQCPLCSYKNAAEANITEHVEDKHPENQYLDKHKCRDCEYKSNGFTELKTHTRKVHISCDKCQQIFETENEMDTHVLQYHVSKAKVKNALLNGDSHSTHPVFNFATA